MKYARLRIEFVLPSVSHDAWTHLDHSLVELIERNVLAAHALVDGIVRLCRHELSIALVALQDARGVPAAVVRTCRVEDTITGALLLPSCNVFLLIQSNHLSFSSCDFPPKIIMEARGDEFDHTEPLAAVIG